MQTFKKVLLSVCSFLLIIILASLVLIEPMINTASSYYHDSVARDKLAGSLDFLFIGDSDGLTAFQPNLFDEKTGYNSYNLSEGQMTGKSEFYFLKKECERNNIKKVVLQIDFSTLYRDRNDEYGEGDSVTYQRISNSIDRVDFLCNYVALNDWLNIYSRLLISGFWYWKESFFGNQNIQKCDYSLKGWHEVESNDLSLSKEQAVDLYNSDTITTNYREDRLSEINNIVDYCISNDIEIMMIVVPVSDSSIWEKSNWDDFYFYMKKYANEKKINFVDFNLYKKRYSLFNDSDCYKDTMHFSKKGSDSFTLIFSEIYSMLEKGNDVSDYFYNNYEEMKKDSPYMEYLK